MCKRMAILCTVVDSTALLCQLLMSRGNDGCYSSVDAQFHTLTLTKSHAPRFENRSQENNTRRRMEMVVTAVLVVMTMVPSVRNPAFPCSQRHQERRRLRHLALLPGRRDHGVGVELQTSQAALVSNADPSAPWNNDYFGKNSLLGGWHFNLPIPFASSVRVTLQLPAWFPGCDDRIFAMVRGVENYPVTVAGFNLPPAARLVASVVNASLAPLEFHNLVTVPSLPARAG